MNETRKFVTFHYYFIAQSYLSFFCNAVSLITFEDQFGLLDMPLVVTFLCQNIETQNTINLSQFVTDKKPNSHLFNL